MYVAVLRFWHNKLNKKCELVSIHLHERDAKQYIIEAIDPNCEPAITLHRIELVTDLFLKLADSKNGISITEEEFDRYAADGSIKSIN